MLRGGVRDIDELVAVAMEAIEGDVTDHDMCMDLIKRSMRSLIRRSSRKTASAEKA